MPSTNIDPFNGFVNAKAFKEYVEAGNCYLYVGRSHALSSSSSSSWDLRETEPEHREVWNNMIALKKISTAYLCVERIDWSVGTVFDQYDSSAEILGNKDASSATDKDSFYCIVQNGTSYYLYKIISNGSKENCPGNVTESPDPYSTVGTSTNVNAFSARTDKYKFKFLSTIAPEFVKYLTSDWIPVEESEFADSDDQSSVKAAAVDGSIEHIKVTEGGAGYTSAPTVTISGDGSGATATAYIVDQTSSSSSSSSGEGCEYTTPGAVYAIEVTNQGSGYTYATVSLSGGGGSGATGQAMISPSGGHGYNVAQELGARDVLVYVQLDSDDNTHFPVDVDFREFGVVAEPRLWNSDTKASGNSYRQTWQMQVYDSGGSINASTFTEDDIITGDTSGATARVIAWEYPGDAVSLSSSSSSSTSDLYGVLQLTDVDGTFEDGEDIETGTATITNIEEPQLQPGSGSIIHHRRINPITRTDNSLETFRIVFGF